MNIFVLDINPVKAARYHCDKHVVKMILESAQLLCTALHEKGIHEEWMYKATHKNHPCAIWVRESRSNFNWLLCLLSALLKEYTLRYGKTHKTTTIYNQLNKLEIAGSIDYSTMTPFALCMPDEYKVEGNPVLSYRKYYMEAKRDICKWKLKIPAWWNDATI